MRKLALFTASAVAFGAAPAANATVIIDFIEGAAIQDLSGYQVIDQFNDDSGISSGSNYVIQSVNNGDGAPPASSDPQGTPYLSVRGGGNASIDLGGVSTFAFEWGSLDAFNLIEIFFNGGSTQNVIPGTTFVNMADGNQVLPTTNGVLRVRGDAGETFDGFRLSSSQNSLEIDNLATGVPEPATWALMIMGVGLIGGAMRRRQTVRYNFA